MSDRFAYLSFLGLLEACDEGVIVLDLSGVCRFMSRSVGEIFGIDTSVYVGRPRTEILHHLAESLGGESLEELFQTEAVDLMQEVEVDVPRFLSLRVSGRTVRTSGGPVARMVLFQDITKQRALERSKHSLEARLDAVAPYDLLTGLPNWRRFVEDIEREHARSMRSGSRYAVLRIDIDGFREINSRLGHPVGDRVLEEVAELLNGNRREYDVFARYEGDEFCVLLPSVDDESARAIAARFVDSLAPQDFRLPDARRVTVSVGGAMCNVASGEAWSEVLARAGKALFLAKESAPAAVRFE